MTTHYQLPLLEELSEIASQHNADLTDLHLVYQQAYNEHRMMTGSLAHLLYENGTLYDEKMQERHLYQMQRVREFAKGVSQE